MAFHRQNGQRHDARGCGGLFSPNLVEEILQSAGHMMAGHAASTRFDCVCNLRNRADVEFSDLALDIGLRKRKAFADNSALFGFLIVDIDAQLFQIHASALRQL